MLEKIYEFTKSDTKNINKMIDDDNILINHMCFPAGEGLPEHYSNSNVYMVVLSGILSLKLDDQEVHKYEQGQIINIPYHAKMNVNNFDADILELFVIKAPNPKNYKE
jgi:quercetin dioxygenase-like cupin family protein